ncbi:hypothetical protein Q5P01_003003 [Channa striata]|uniref:Uncharacterized protein n=1 Tax=Channa striata TaxID=64152 RepID=A0AA88NQD5_CHASR|nr:hypothetical protein Q5P01_003003 [Channa striata]
MDPIDQDHIELKQETIHEDHNTTGMKEEPNQDPEYGSNEASGSSDQQKRSRTKRHKRHCQPCDKGFPTSSDLKQEADVKHDGSGVDSEEASYLVSAESPHRCKSQVITSDLV